MQTFGIPFLKKGGIHIKKKNKGLFTKYCNGKVTEECIQKGKNSPDPKIRKRATFAANSRRWSKKHSEGGELTPEDSVRLVKLKPRFNGPDASDEEFFNTWNFKKDDSDVANYFNSYLNSKGFGRIINNQNKWWESRHPYRKFYSNPDQGTKVWFDIAKQIEPSRYTATMHTDLSATYTLPEDNHRTLIVGQKPYDNFIPTFVMAHEYAHGKAPYTVFGAKQFDKASAQAEALNQNTNTKPGHDSRREEKHADIWGLKYLFYKEGIYDSRSNKNINLKQIKELRKKYPNLRPFQQMSDEQIMFQMNNVALDNQFNDKLKQV